jgi:hypothetical protein
MLQCSNAPSLRRYVIFVIYNNNWKYDFVWYLYYPMPAPLIESGQLGDLPAPRL